MQRVVISRRESEKAILNREWISALSISLVTAILLSLPYILGYLSARPGLAFTGVVMNPEDTQSYFAKMLQGYDGSWLYTIPFTSEPQSPAFLGGFYLALGHIARWFGLTITAIWHMARFAATMFLFAATFGFISTFLDDKRSRWIAFLLALFGSGFGWILFLLQQTYWLGAFPLDFKMPEAHLFFTALTFPHVAMGTGLILISFWFAYQIGQGNRKNWYYLLAAGATNLALGIVYPFLIYLVALVWVLAWILLLFRERQFLWSTTWRFAACFLPALPLFLYYAYTYLTNDVFRAWSQQALTLSPPWPHYLVAFGPLLLLALLPVLSKHKPLDYWDKTGFLWIWILSVVLLIYAPLNQQRRFVQGVHVPLSILATVGLVKILLPRAAKTRAYRKIVSFPRYTDEGMKRLITVGLLLILALSNLYLYFDVAATAGFRQKYPFFRLENELHAVDWLRTNSDQNQVVLAAYTTGNYIAAHAGNRVFIGHWAETGDWESKHNQVSEFFKTSTADSWRRSFLNDYKVKYLFYGPVERSLGSFDPSAVPYLEVVYRKNQFAIFKVNLPNLG